VPLLTSRVIQTFQSEGILETRRGSILVAMRTRCGIRSCLCNEASKITSTRSCEGSIGPEKGQLSGSASENELTTPNKSLFFDVF